MFDGGDQRDEAARAGLTVDEFREWSELNGTPVVRPCASSWRGVPTGRRAYAAIAACLASPASCRAMPLTSPVTGARLIGAIPRPTISTSP